MLLPTLNQPFLSLFSLIEMFCLYRPYLRVLFISDYNAIRFACLSSRSNSSPMESGTRPYYEQILPDGRVFVKVRFGCNYTGF